MAAAYAAWTDAAAHWASRREAAAAALRHWEHSAAASAFATWHDVAAEHYNTDAAASHHCIRVLKAAFHAIGREYMPKTVPACVPLLGSVAIARAQQHCKGSRTIDG
jgi:hypothetical protein